jgi:hypothetical protein
MRLRRRTMDEETPQELSIVTADFYGRLSLGSAANV